MATTAPELAWGRARVGSIPWGGFSPAEVTPVVDVSGLPGIVANDRYQMFVESDHGGAASFPQLRYWLAQPPEWGAVLASGQPDNLVQFFALDEDDRPVDGALELPYVDIPKGQAASITHVLVEFIPRPAILGGFDGGVEPDEIVGFEVWVEASGVVDLELPTTGARVSGVDATRAGTVALRAEEGGSSAWPNTMTAVFYVRDMLEVRSARVAIRNLHLCMVVAVELYGNPQDNRHG